MEVFVVLDENWNCRNVKGVIHVFTELNLTEAKHKWNQLLNSEKFLLSADQSGFCFNENWGLVSILKTNEVTLYTFLNKVVPNKHLLLIDL